MHVTFIVTGGTIFQTRDPATGCMAIGVSLDDLVSAGALDALGVSSSQVVDLKVRSGAELTFDTIFAARDAVRKRLSQKKDDKQKKEKRPTPAFVLVTGTDTLEEFAFCLDLLIGSALVAASASLVVTGAMKPYDIEGYDGRINLQQAVQVATSPHAGQFGVLVALNDDIHLARYVRKADSQLMGAFQSHPGPVGQVRSGRVRFYYGPPPDAASWRDPRLADLDAKSVRPYGSRVGIWVTGVSSTRVPEALLAELAGLVVAAPGTGSLSPELADQLASWTARLPVVLTSRCGVGCNFDDHYYRGSRTKYESRGFLLGGDFAHLNPVQARSLLVLRLAAGLHPQVALTGTKRKRVEEDGEEEEEEDEVEGGGEEEEEGGEEEENGGEDEEEDED